MRTFIGLILLFAISACYCDTVVYEEGTPRAVPVPLSFGNLMSKGAWEGSWQSRKVRYPLVGQYLLPIVYIKVVNNLDSSYSTATIRSGGVGSNYVEIEYYAPAYRGYDYSVEIQ